MSSKTSPSSERRPARTSQKKKPFHRPVPFPVAYSLPDNSPPGIINTTQIPGCPILRLTPRDEPRASVRISHFLHTDLGVPALNDIHAHLWWAGRPGLCRPLSFQHMIRRTIILAELPRLHLVWYDSVIYVHPLRRYLLNYEFFAEHIAGDRELYGLAVGFLRTWAHLMQRESDFDIARRMGLIPVELGWHQWSNICAGLLEAIDPADVNKRYIYGELRFRRLEHITYYLRGSLWTNGSGTRRGYYTVAPLTLEQWSAQRFIFVQIVIVIFITTLMAATQVVIGTRKASDEFLGTAYRFGIGVLLGIPSLGAVLAVFFVALGVYRVCRKVRELRHSGPGYE